MKLEPFLLDHWLEKYESSKPPIQFHLASSTGPRWTTNELLGLISPDERQDLLDSYLLYSRSQGMDQLREAIGEMVGTAAENVLVLTGAAEALEFERVISHCSSSDRVRRRVQLLRCY